MVIMKGSEVNGLYVLNGKTVVGKASVSDSSWDRFELWHLRLGHMRGLKKLQKQRVFGNDKLSSLGFCEDCILEKASKLKFETIVHTPKDKLRYIHSELWGLE